MKHRMAGWLAMGLIGWALIGSCSASQEEESTRDTGVDSSTPDTNMATPRSGGSLIDHNDWVINPRGETLFGAASAACEPETSFRAEELGGEFVFAIETMDCSTLSVEQGSRLAIRSGDVIKLRFFHANLTAPTGAVARIAVAVGEKIIWSIEVPIPSSWAFLTETIPIDFDAPADTPISFHVANHGANEYALIALTLQN